MGVEVTDLGTLDSATVTQEVELLTEMLQELAPSLDLRRGVVHDLVLYYGGVLAAKNQVEHDRLRRSMSLQEILADPTLADDETVDQIASNYRVTRRPGSKAEGELTVVVNQSADVTIGVGSRFVSNGLGFVTAEAYVGRADAGTVVLPTDRALRLRRDGNYEFSIPVLAEETGDAYELRAGTSVLAEDPPPSYVKAYVTGDFVGGVDADDNATLVARFIHGMSAKTLCTRDNMSAVLREAFPDVVSDSIVGFGDPEMLRDRHTIFPVSLGGRIDWYVRPRPRYRRYVTTMSASLVELPNDGSAIWQLTFGRDDYPGLYYVSVLPGDADDLSGSLEITQETREADLTAIPGELVPDIVNPIEAEYSRYQAVVVRFKDPVPVSGSSVGDVADYQVIIRAVDDLAAIQTLVSGRDARHAAGDVLIKAPVPCFVSLSFTITIEAGQPDPDLSAIAEDLADLVNHYGFSGRLPASALSDRVHNALSGRSSVGPIDMFARIRYPGGRWQVLRSDELLTIPDDPDAMVSGRTAVFYLDPDDVSVSVEEAQLPDV
jgi:hypothetical protein